MSTVGLVVTKNNRQEHRVITEIGEEISQILNPAGFFDAAPFQTVLVILRLGTREQEEPENLGVDKKHELLELAIETEAEILNWKIRPPDYIKRKWLPPILRAVRWAARKYELPIDGLDVYEARVLAGETLAGETLVGETGD